MKILIIKLFLDENNTLKYDDPICPVCGSHKIIKKCTIKKNKQNTMEKQQNSKNSNINAKNVEKNSKIYNNPLIGKNKQFLQEIMDKIPGIMKIWYQSPRKISKYFEIFLGIRISHQTIKNWFRQKSRRKHQQ